MDLSVDIHTGGSPSFAGLVCCGLVSPSPPPPPRATEVDRAPKQIASGLWHLSCRWLLLPSFQPKQRLLLGIQLARSQGPAGGDAGGDSGGLQSSANTRSSPSPGVLS